MSKKKHQLIPLLDYLRIHRVIRSVLDSAGATTDRACWFFSVAGAAILRHHYGKDAQPLAGAVCLMVNEKGLMFCVSPQSMAAKYIAPATLFMQWLPAATI
ncbi:DUF2026 family protein [Pseudomonas aeruginosa]|nr:DUF2026 family protein [Pseudomonas aeruginosa]